MIVLEVAADVVLVDMYPLYVVVVQLCSPISWHLFSDRFSI